MRETKSMFCCCVLLYHLKNIGKISHLNRRKKQKRKEKDDDKNKINNDDDEKNKKKQEKPVDIF